jgi:hypothetical protein
VSGHTWHRANPGAYITRMTGHTAAAFKITDHAGKVRWLSTVDGDMLAGSSTSARLAKRAAELRITRIVEA